MWRHAYEVFRFFLASRLVHHNVRGTTDAAIDPCVGVGIPSELYSVLFPLRLSIRFYCFLVLLLLQLEKPVLKRLASVQNRFWDIVENLLILFV